MPPLQTKVRRSVGPLETCYPRRFLILLAIEVDPQRERGNLSGYPVAKQIVPENSITPVIRKRHAQIRQTVFVDRNPEGAMLIRP